MKHKTRTKTLSWLLSLALMLSLLPGISLTAYADFQIAINPAGGGSVTQVAVENGSQCTAIPAAGYKFQKWTFNYSSGTTYTAYNNPYTVNSEKNVTAHFVQIVYVTGVTLEPSSTTLTVDNTATLTATVNPGSATDKTVTWTTSDASVATVANGVVTAVGAGTATITATATNGTTDTGDDKAATCTVTVHGHSYSYTATGATITATCNDTTAHAEPYTATLTIKPPANLVYDGKAKAATVEGEIPDVTTPDIMYEGRNGTTYEKSATAPTEMGDYTASVTLGGQTASVDFTIKDASYTIIIPATLTVANAGWNATAGITASGEIAEDKKLTVTAASANEWKLKDGENTVDYYLATEEGGEPATVWDFTVDELAAENGTNKSMGAVVEEYINKPAGDYADTVTFTAEVKSLLNSITIGGVNSTELIYADGDTWAQIVDRNPGKIYIQGTQIWRGQDIALYVGSTPVNINEPFNPSATYKFEAD